MAISKELRPGDLVIGTKTVGVQQDMGVLTRMGLVIGVDYRRNGQHHGCEDRVRVMWVNPIRFEVSCDCGLVRADEF